MNLDLKPSRVVHYVGNEEVAIMAIRKSLEEEFVVQGPREEWFLKCRELLKKQGFNAIRSNKQLFHIIADYKKTTVWGDISLTLKPDAGNATRIIAKATANVDNIYTLFRSPSKLILTNFKDGFLDTEESDDPTPVSSEISLTCPHCKEMINEEAVKCRYCGEWVREKDTLPLVATPSTRGSTGSLAASPAAKTPTGTLSPTSESRANKASPVSNKTIYLAGLVPIVIGTLLGTPFKFILFFALIGVPALLVLFDSSNRYEKPSWLLALFTPAFWITAIIYGIKRLTKKSNRPLARGTAALATKQARGMPAIWQVALVSVTTTILSASLAAAPEDSTSSAKSASSRTIATSSADDEPDTPIETTKQAAAPTIKPRTYDAYLPLVQHFKGLTDLQMTAWNDEEGSHHFVSGNGIVSEVSESGILSGVDGDFYEVTLEVNDSFRAALFLPKDKYKKKVLSLKKGQEMQFSGNLRKLVDLGLWISGDVVAD